MVPALACATTISFLSFPTLVGRPWLVGGALVGAFLTPFVFEATGVWASTWEIVGKALISR